MTLMPKDALRLLMVVMTVFFSEDCLLKEKKKATFLQNLLLSGFCG